MIYKWFNFRSLGVVFLMVASLSLMAAGNPDEGKKLFKSYCGACHAKDMKSASTGPALGGARAAWGDDEALFGWVRNSQGMIAKGHPRAVELWNKYKPTVMTSFPNLKDEELESLFAYIEGVANGTYGAKKGGPSTGDKQEVVAKHKGFNWWFYGLLLGGLGLLAVFLMRIIANMDVVAAAKEGKFVEPKSLWEQLTSKGLISLLTFCFIVFAGYTTVRNAVNLGRQQGYEPDQPIKFSHKTHAGVHKINCQYCHDGARRSKHSIIPATNTCLNCHKAIKNGSTYGTAELTKIYASIGFDPLKGKYVEGYENMSIDDAKKIYAPWIADQYMSDNDLTDLDAEGKELVEKQWADIVSALTNDQKKDKLFGPIEWIRVHNLPDHVYYNHAQHVSVGKLECQTCHGKIEEMDVVAQYAPLSMGWCINCHRQTDVKFNDNDYYKSYEKFHEEIKAGKRESVKVADIGGLECQKCHY